MLAMPKESTISISFLTRGTKIIANCCGDTGEDTLQSTKM